MILATFILGCLSMLNAQIYTDFTTLNNDVSFYNNEVAFPAGSVLQQFGNIKIINDKAANDILSPTILDSVVMGAFYINSAIFFKGKLIFDVSGLPSHCRKITFKTNTDTIFVDSYVYDLGAGTPLPILLGDSARIEDPGDGSGLRAVGRFNSIAVKANQIGSAQSRVFDFLIESCSGAEFCNANFEYDIIGDEIDLNNTSSLLSTDAESFVWSINSMDLIDENDNIIYPHESQEKIEVCLSLSLSTCINGSSFMKCDSVQIKSYREDLDNGENYTLTPNDDGVQDYIDLLAGTKIFDRNGFLQTEIQNDTQWIGTNYKKYPLPTGLYTALYNNSKFNITIVR